MDGALRCRWDRPCDCEPEMTETNAVTKAYKRDEYYQDRGEIEIGPDTIVGYAKGTRAAGASALGAVGKEVLTTTPRSGKK